MGGGAANLDARAFLNDSTINPTETLRSSLSLLLSGSIDDGRINSPPNSSRHLFRERNTIGWVSLVPPAAIGLLGACVEGCLRISLVYLVVLLHHE